jgi:hypothetical protein
VKLEQNAAQCGTMFRRDKNKFCSTNLLLYFQIAVSLLLAWQAALS